MLHNGIKLQTPCGSTVRSYGCSIKGFCYNCSYAVYQVGGKQRIPIDNNSSCLDYAPFTHCLAGSSFDLLARTAAQTWFGAMEPVTRYLQLSGARHLSNSISKVWLLYRGHYALPACIWLPLLIWWSFSYMGLILTQGCTPCVYEIVIWARASQDAQSVFSVETGSRRVCWSRSDMESVDTSLSAPLLPTHGGLAWDCQECWHQHSLVSGLWRGSCTKTDHEALFVQEPIFSPF